MPRRTLPAALLACALLAAPAAAQSLDPGLTIDQRFAPPDGVSRYDFTAGGTDIPGAVAASGDTIYTVGETRDTASNSDVGIVARQSNGLLDARFDADGLKTVAPSAGTGKDVPVDVAALPDGRLRILASYDADATDASNISTVVIGLLPDGSLDTGFGGGDGLATFKAGTGTGPDAPTRMAIAEDGRMAITGGVTVANSREDSFVALLDASGARVASFGDNGVRRLDRAPSALNDRGVDVAWRPGGGLLAFLRVETNPADSVNDYVAVLRGLDDVTGADLRGFGNDGDLQLAIGTPDTIAGGMLVHGGRILVAGSTRNGLDTDAFVARLNPDGSDVQSRLFDMRGATIEDAELVTSAVSELAVVPGPPETLVGAGSINYSSRPYWAAVAFQNTAAPLDQWRLGDLIVPTAEYGALIGVAPLGDGTLGVAGSLVNVSSNFDTSFGTARLLVDVKKTCDLQLTVPKPLELAFPSGASAPVTVQVTNVGTRPCGGPLAVSERFALSGQDPVVPTLDPGQTWTSSSLVVSDTAARRSDDVATFTVTGPRDTDRANDRRQVRVRFDYCDLALTAPGSAPLMPTEGVRPFELSVRNVGTQSCAGVAVGGDGKSSGSPFALRRGRSASVDVPLRAPRGARPGSTATMAFTATATQQSNPDNDGASMTVRYAAPGDTTIRRANRRLVAGTATPGNAGRRASRAAKRAVRLAAVEVSIQRPGRRCASLTGASGKLRVAKGKRCGARTWIAAKGTAKFRLRLRKALPKGRYVVQTRAVARDGGLLEARFTRADRNTTTFRAR